MTTGGGGPGGSRGRLARVAPALARPLGALALALAILAAVRFASTHDLASPALLRSWFAPLGAWGPLAFAAVYAAGTVLALPGTAFTVAAVILFGPWWGFAVALAGATLGAAGAFAVARGLGRRPVVRRFGHLERWRSIDGVLERHGAVAVLLLRLLPVLPYNVLNYACGLTGVRFAPFAAATLVGMAPATAVVCYSTAVLAAPGAGWTSPRAVLALGLLAVLLVGLPLAWRWRSRQGGERLLDRLARKLEGRG